MRFKRVLRLSKPRYSLREKDLFSLAMDRYIERHPRGRARAGEDERPTSQTPDIDVQDRPRTTRQTDDSTRVCGSCGRTCKNEKGLKIHRAKMGCPPILRMVQRTGQPHETEEGQDQVTPHRVQNLQVPSQDEADSASSESVTTEGSEETSTRDIGGTQDGTTANDARKERLKWPASSQKKAWHEFEEEVDMVLETTLAGTVDRKLAAMATIMYSMGLSRFGVQEKRAVRTTPILNRRRHKINQLRGDIRRLTARYKSASEEERPALAELRKNLREQIASLRRAENSRKNRKERSRKRASFTANPFQFMKKLLGDKRSGRLECPRQEVEDHLRSAHSDDNREEDLGDPNILMSPEPPKSAFEDAEPRLQEVREVIRKARAGSAPGPNGIPYKVYKNCPKLLERLWRLLKVVWRKGQLPGNWLLSEGCFIPKEEDSKTLKQFRTISLLNVEGKVFLSVLARRLTSYMLANDYMDTSVQKGGVPGVSGCLEHTSVLTQLIKEAKATKGDLTVLWLDLANAYGTVPHKLVDLTLKKYFVPEKFQKLLKHYFDNFKMRFTVSDYTTSWQRLEVGIVTGCTISVILFSAAMNLMVKTAEKMSRGPVTISGVRQPPTRAFMDDMTITAKSVPEGRWMLEDLERLISWSRMKFKPVKCRSLVLKKGKVQDRFRFRMNGELVPTVTEQPVKSLGKWFRSSLSDNESVKEMRQQVDDWMQAVDKSGLPGKYKAWIYQHGVLPRLLWPLLVYDVPTSTVEAMEKRLSGYIRRWLGVPRSFSSIGLYSSGSKLQLPLSSVTEEFKVTKVRQVMMLRDSADEKVSGAHVEVNTGRKWRAQEAVDNAESRLRHSDIVGTTTSGRLGLGCVTRASWKSASLAEKRQMVQGEVRSAEEESRQAAAVSMKKQGSWLKWDGVQSRKMSWNDMWRMEPQRIGFLLRSVYDVLPTPTNLRTWKLTEDPSCKLCGRPANLEHILSSCKTALADGRYRWRHDKILSEIAASIDVARRNKKAPVQSKPTFINFVREKESAPASNKSTKTGLLAAAGDWELQVDLKRQLRFPPEVATTTMRPDVLLLSRATRTVALLELTVPWEERMEEAHERKKAKYQPLLDECQQRGWKTWNLPVEVGSRGFAGQSLWRAYGVLGITGMARRRAISDVCRQAESASQWVWQKREQQWNANQSLAGD